MPTVSFVREGIRIEVGPGTTLRKAASHAGVRLYVGVFRLLNCHGRGRCGKCRLRVDEGGDNLSKVTAKERSLGRPRCGRHRGNHGIDESGHERLACQARVWGDVRVWTRLAV